MKKVERYFYPAVFTYESGQEIAVVFPDAAALEKGMNFSQVLQDAIRERLNVSIDYLVGSKLGSFYII